MTITYSSNEALTIVMNLIKNMILTKNYEITLRKTTFKKGEIQYHVFYKERKSPYD